MFHQDDVFIPQLAIFPFYLHHKPEKMPPGELNRIIGHNCACPGKKGLQSVKDCSDDNCEALVIRFKLLWPFPMYSKFCNEGAVHVWI